MKVHELIYTMLQERPHTAGEIITKLKDKMIELTPSNVRTIIYEMVMQGYLVGSNRNHYFLIRNERDFKIAKKHLANRIRKQARRLKTLCKNYEKSLSQNLFREEVTQ